MSHILKPCPEYPPLNLTLTLVTLLTLVTPPQEHGSADQLCEPVSPFLVLGSS